MLKAVRHEGGFTIPEVLIGIALVGIVTATALPLADVAARSYRIKGDAQSIANVVSLAKMRAASRFSRARVRADLLGNTYRLEIWNKTTLAWDAEGGDIPLSRGVTFGFAGLGAAPPNSQVAIGQSPLCTTTGPNDPAPAFENDTACIVFNSRGIPVDNFGAPLGGNALYVTDGTGVYATTITATPLVRQWWSHAGAVGWVQR